MEIVDSPQRPVCRPRALTFGDSPGNSNNASFLSVNMSPHKGQHAVSSTSPPYRKVRELRLFDTPHTPNTIMQKSAVTRLRMSRSKHIFFNCDNDTKLLQPGGENLYEDVANINPFTPNSIQQNNRKRSRTMVLRENVSSDLRNKHRASAPPISSSSELSEDETEQLPPAKRILQESNIPRFHKEFVEKTKIGAGEFGEVYRCLNRLDGCEYAVKRTIKPVSGSALMESALIEVWAHAVLGKHDNVVRYYSAWQEDGHMLIQNEYCDGGSLQTLLEKRFLNESELRILLTHVANGLKYIHSIGLCHMDIKSGNIFLSKVSKKTTYNDAVVDCDESKGKFNDSGNDDYLTIYKIGDLGHVTSIHDPRVEEGDCRYLPSEILQEDFSNLVKADMFSLGMTLYEAGGGAPLPKNGDEWHRLRNGQVPDLPRLSRDFNNLIKLLMHPDPKERPSSTSIFEHPVLCPSEITSMSQLTHELIMERKRNDLLQKQVQKLTIQLQEKNAEIKRNRKIGLTPQHNSDRMMLRSYSKKTEPLAKDARRSAINNRDQNKNIPKTVNLIV